MLGSPLRPTYTLTRQPVDRLGVGGEDLAAALGREAGGEGAEGVVEVPVRVVGGEQETIPADQLHHVEEVPRLGGLLDRLGGDPDVLADVLRRLALEVGDLAAHALEQPVEAPGQRRQPREAALDEHHLELREALEHALDDEARDHGLARGGMPGALLHVVGRPAGAGVGMAAGAEHVQRHGQPVPLGRLVDRPVAAVARGLRAARQHEDLRVGRIGRAALDLLYRGGGVLVGHHQPRAQARLASREDLALPVVGGGGERRRQVQVHLALAGDAERPQDAEGDAVGVEILAPDQVQVGAGTAAVVRPGVAAAGERRRLGIGLEAHAVAAARAVGRQHLPPARRQVGLEVGERAQRRVHVAVDDGEAGLLSAAWALAGIGFGCRRGIEHHVGLLRLRRG